MIMIGRKCRRLVEGRERETKSKRCYGRERCECMVLSLGLWARRKSEKREVIRERELEMRCET